MSEPRLRALRSGSSWGPRPSETVGKSVRLCAGCEIFQGRGCTALSARQGISDSKLTQTTSLLWYPRPTPNSSLSPQGTVSEVGSPGCPSPLANISWVPRIQSLTGELARPTTRPFLPRPQLASQKYPLSPTFHQMCILNCNSVLGSPTTHIPLSRRGTQSDVCTPPHVLNPSPAPDARGRVWGERPRGRGALGPLDGAWVY